MDHTSLILLWDSLDFPEQGQVWESEWEYAGLFGPRLGTGTSLLQHSVGQRKSQCQLRFKERENRFHFLMGSIDLYLHAFFFLIESYRMWTTCRTFNVWLVNKNYFNVCLVPFYFYEVICYSLYLCELLWHCYMVSLRYLNPVLYFPMTCLDFLISQKKAIIMQTAMNNIKWYFLFFTLFPYFDELWICMAKC